MKKLGLTLIFGVLVAVVGCSSYRASVSPHATLPLPADVQQYYAYSPIQPSVKVHVLERNPSYWVKEATLDMGDGSEPIQLVWYTPTTSEKRPLILISPIRGSDTLIVGGCAEVFADCGYQAAIVKRAHVRFDPAGPLTQVEDSLRTAVIRHRQALDWLTSQPGVDRERVGTFGISYGAILTSVLAAVDPRVKVCVIDLAGGPLAGVMRSSEEGSLRRSWARSRAGHDLTSKELYEELLSVIRTDPVKLAPYVERDRVLMLIARYDSSVPTRYQLKLWKALGRPRADFVPLGHYTSILALPAHRLNVMRFFADNLDRAAADAPVNTATEAKD